MTLTITGRIPSKKNSKRIVTNGAGRPFIISSEDYVNWHEQKMWELARNRPATPFQHAEISIKFYPPHRIKGDLTNKAESIMDLLVDARYLVDDNWFALAHVCLTFGEVDPKNPRAEVHLQELVA